MIGKAALTEKEGQLFVITSIDTKTEETPIYHGFKMTPAKRDEKVKETKPRILCDIQDLLDYQKVGSETLKLINREAEERMAKEDAEVKPENEL